MPDLQKLQVIAQLIENMIDISDKMEKSFAQSSGENFEIGKKEILEIQKKVSELMS